MSYENKFGLVRLIAIVLYIALLLIGNKYPTAMYILWKDAIIDAYAAMFLISFYKIAKEAQQYYTMELGEIYVKH